jgi:hypothetical protein
MNAKQLAAQLNGREYGREITKEEEAAAKKAGLVVVYGASDDLVELRGAIEEEVGAYDGTTLYLHRGGVLPDPEAEDCERCQKRVRSLMDKCLAVEVLWDDPDKDSTWYIKTTAKHEEFFIMEDDEKFCRGIVVSVKDLPTVSGIGD